MAIVNGTSGNDTLYGSNQDDQISGQDGNDLLIGNNGNDFFDGGTGDDQLLGGNGHDVFYGGDGNDFIWAASGDDYINPRNNSGFPSTGLDFLDPGEGYDVIDFSTVTEGWFLIHHWSFSAGIEFYLDGATNTAWVDKGLNGFTSIIDINNAIDNLSVQGPWGVSVLSLSGTAFDDVFTIDTNTSNSYVEIAPGGGNDTLNLTLQGIVRIVYTDGWIYPGTMLNGVTVNLATGIVSDDGYGGTDTINAVDLGGTLELHLSNFDDHVIGSDRDDRVILYAGNNYFDGGDGQDLVRYDRAGVESVYVDLEAGIASGMRYGLAINDTLINVEDVSGSRSASDTLLGSSADNVISGNGGDDYLDGRAGNDTLDGGGGSDTFKDHGGSVLTGSTSIPGNGNENPGLGIGHEIGNGKGHDSQGNGKKVGHLIHGGGASEASDSDVYYGGSGADLFIFETANGNDTIGDFDVNSGDVIDISDWGLTEFQDLLAIADVNGAGDVVVELGENASITLTGVSLADLSSDDFIFA